MTLQVSPLKPNKAQAEALQALQDTRDKKAGLVALATGVGKTFLAAWDSIQCNAQRILYVVHQNDILYQNADEFAFVYRHDTEHPTMIKEKMGYVNGDHKDYEKSIVFATWQTLARENNLQWLDSVFWDYVIVDEAHHVRAETFGKVFNAIHSDYTLGLTATPFRMDGKSIVQYFNDNLVKQLNVNQAIKEGHLVPYQYHLLWDNIDYSKIARHGKRFSVKSLEKNLIIDERNDAIVQEYQEQIPDRQTIGFCVSVTHAKKMAQRFKQAGINAVALTHKDGRNERRDIIRAFEHGKYQVIFTRDLFNEGVDFPNVSGVLLLRPTDSDVVFTQQIGRGLRKSEGKHNVVILDFVGNDRNGIAIRQKVLEIDGKELKKNRPRPRQETIHHEPIVWFQNELIDLSRRLDKIHHNRAPSKEELTKAYFRLKNSFAVPDNLTQRRIAIAMLTLSRPTSRKPKYTMKDYQTAWGTFYNFLKEAHEIEPFDAALHGYYQHLKENLGYVPSESEYNTSRSGLKAYQISNYTKRFSQWSTWLKIVGDYGSFLERQRQIRKSIEEASVAADLKAYTI